jgi:site-specific DNA-methyltransferase (adenine-specific)
MLFFGDALDAYQNWSDRANPTTIISDGPYGLGGRGGFVGDSRGTRNIAEWYRPHIEKWAEAATPETTLWFWSSELAWAKVHNVLEELGWEYRAANVWDKGMAHVAGRTNTKTLRQLPVVTEICVQYIRKPIFQGKDGAKFLAQQWLRNEWIRTGIPLSHANKACGVKNAATRKYLTADYAWYFPPPAVFEKLSDYANQHGSSEGKPYFSMDGKTILKANEWERLQAKFHCPAGVTNVWRENAVSGKERIKVDGKTLHPNQKPLKLMKLIISLSSDEGDAVWEPFGGLFTGCLAAQQLKRAYCGAEISPVMYKRGAERLNTLVH